jgi:hypothetical protein
MSGPEPFAAPTPARVGVYRIGPSRIRPRMLTTARRAMSALAAACTLLASAAAASPPIPIVPLGADSLEQSALREYSITSDTTWVVGCPAVIIGTLIVEDGATLTIQPGVSVVIDVDAMLIIRGGLRCMGTPDSMVVFEPFRPGDRWGGIGIIEADETVEIRHARLVRTHPISFHQTPLPGVVTSYSSDVIVSDCEFDDDWYGSGVALRHGATGLITRSSFTGFRGQIISGIQSVVDVIDNYLGYSYQDAIELGDNPMAIEISGNVIEANGDDGIDLDFFFGLVAGNVITACADKAISVSQGSVAQLHNNIVSGSGTGIGVTAGALALLCNNTVTGCLTGVRAEEVHPGLGGVHVFGYNNIIWDHLTPLRVGERSTLEFAYSNVGGDTTLAGEGNIRADPRFENAAGGDFHLLAGSPCIDAGYGIGIPEFDFEGDPRIDDPWTPNTGGGTITYCDIGADEYRPNPAAVALERAPPRSGALRVIPNPLRVGAPFRIETTWPAAGGLRLIDVHGRARRSWPHLRLPANLRWDGRDQRGHRLAAGVYWLELRTGAQTAVPSTRSTRIVIVP